MTNLPESLVVFGGGGGTTDGVFSPIFVKLFRFIAPSTLLLLPLLVLLCVCVCVCVCL